MADGGAADPRGAMPLVVAAACDGACSGNPGPGGWGALLRFADGSLRELGGADGATTNNRMELTAALALLEVLRDLPRAPGLTIRTDSRYLIDGLQKWLPGWKRKGWRTASGGAVLNRDLWERLDRSRVEGVSLVHVRGHSGDPDNDRCDAIAVAFARGQRPPLSPGPGGAGLGGSAAARRATAVSPGRGVSAPARGPASRAAAAPADSAVSGADPGGGSVSEAAARGASGRGVRGATAEGSAGAGGESVCSEGAARQGAARQGVAQEGADGLGTGPAELPLDPAPPALQRLMGRLELAERLAAGGHGLSLAELAQLVEMPLRSLETRSGSWRWRDWLVHPLGDGRWRLERDAQGLQAPE